MGSSVVWESSRGCLVALIWCKDAGQGDEFAQRVPLQAPSFDAETGSLMGKRLPIRFGSQLLHRLHVAVGLELRQLLANLRALAPAKGHPHCDVEDSKRWNEQRELVG